MTIEKAERQRINETLISYLKHELNLRCRLRYSRWLGEDEAAHALEFEWEGPEPATSTFWSIRGAVERFIGDEAISADCRDLDVIAIHPSAWNLPHPPPGSVRWDEG